MWHQYEISALISWSSFHGETSNSITKCQLFSQASRLSIASHADILLVLHHGQKCTPQIWKCAVIAHIFYSSFQRTFIGGMCDKPKESLGFLVQCTWVCFLFLWELPNQNSVVYAVMQIKIPSEKFAFIVTSQVIIICSIKIFDRKFNFRHNSYLHPGKPGFAVLNYSHMFNSKPWFLSDMDL